MFDAVNKKTLRANPIGAIKLVSIYNPILSSVIDEFSKRSLESANNLDNRQTHSKLFVSDSVQPVLLRQTLITEFGNENLDISARKPVEQESVVGNEDLEKTTFSNKDDVIHEDFTGTALVDVNIRKVTNKRSNRSFDRNLSSSSRIVKQADIKQFVQVKQKKPTSNWMLGLIREFEDLERTVETRSVIGEKQEDVGSMNVMSCGVAMKRGSFLILLFSKSVRQLM